MNHVSSMLMRLLIMEIIFQDYVRSIGQQYVTMK